MKKESGADPVFPQAQYGQPVPRYCQPTFYISENSPSHTRILLNHEDILLFSKFPMRLSIKATLLVCTIMLTKIMVFRSLPTGLEDLALSKNAFFSLNYFQDQHGCTFFVTPLPQWFVICDRFNYLIIQIFQVLNRASPSALRHCP